MAQYLHPETRDPGLKNALFLLLRALGWRPSLALVSALSITPGTHGALQVGKPRCAKANSGVCSNSD